MRLRFGVADQSFLLGESAQITFWLNEAGRASRLAAQRLSLAPFQKPRWTRPSVEETIADEVATRCFGSGYVELDELECEAVRCLIVSAVESAAHSVHVAGRAEVEILPSWPGRAEQAQVIVSRATFAPLDLRP